MAGPDRPPLFSPNTGRRVRGSIAIPTKVFRRLPYPVGRVAEPWLERRALQAALKVSSLLRTTNFPSKRSAALTALASMSAPGAGHGAFEEGCVAGYELAMAFEEVDDGSAIDQDPAA